LAKDRRTRQQQRKPYLQRRVDKLRDRYKNVVARQRKGLKTKEQRAQKQPTVATAIADDLLTLIDATREKTQALILAGIRDEEQRIAALLYGLTWGLVWGLTIGILAGGLVYFMGFSK
jgi:CRP-like cAMP-binding protein